MPDKMNDVILHDLPFQFYEIECEFVLSRRLFATTTPYDIFYFLSRKGSLQKKFLVITKFFEVRDDEYWPVRTLFMELSSKNLWTSVLISWGAELQTPLIDRPWILHFLILFLSIPWKYWLFSSPSRIHLVLTFCYKSSLAILSSSKIFSLYFFQGHLSTSVSILDPASFSKSSTLSFKSLRVSFSFRCSDALQSQINFLVCLRLAKRNLYVVPKPEKDFRALENISSKML